MNVLAVLPPSPWMEINIVATLRRYYATSLEVFHYPGMGELGSRQWRAQRDELNESLLRRARDLHSAGRLDLIFCIVYDDFLRIDTAKRLRALNVPMVNYHIDMVFQWYRVIRSAPYFDVLAVAQSANAERLAPYNPNIEYMPMAANPDFYCQRAALLPAYQHGVSFVGSFNPHRRAWLAECVKRGVKPVVYGQGWLDGKPTWGSFKWDLYKVVHDLRFYAVPRWRAEGIRSLTGPITRKVARTFPLDSLAGIDYRGTCDDNALPAIFRSSYVNLGFSDTGWHSKKQVLPSGMLQVRLRDFEVPMSGGFYLVQEVPEHRDYYVIGKEIETWSRPEELVDKIMFYTANQAAAERIRACGQQRALQEHTWRHRFDRLFRRLFSRGKS